jgi:hypothetical protein
MYFTKLCLFSEEETGERNRDERETRTQRAMNACRLFVIDREFRWNAYLSTEWGYNAIHAHDSISCISFRNGKRDRAETARAAILFGERSCAIARFYNDRFIETGIFFSRLFIRSTLSPPNWTPFESTVRNDYVNFSVSTLHSSCASFDVHFVEYNAHYFSNVYAVCHAIFQRCSRNIINKCRHRSGVQV